MILGVRQVQEKYIEQNKPLYSVFVDLPKALDTVNLGVGGSLEHAQTLLIGEGFLLSTTLLLLLNS